MRTIPRLLPLALLLGCTFVGGCRKSAPDMYHVSGTVNFDGKSVPAGRITFNPDFAQGNDGPQGWADIKDGKFDSKLDGQGHAGGAMVIRIEGFDGKSDDPKMLGTPIFNPYEIKRELPRDASVQTLEVPASAAKGLVVPTGPGP